MILNYFFLLLIPRKQSNAMAIPAIRIGSSYALPSSTLTDNVIQMAAIISNMTFMVCEF